MAVMPITRGLSVVSWNKLGPVPLNAVSVSLTEVGKALVETAAPALQDIA